MDGRLCIMQLNWVITIRNINKIGNIEVVEMLLKKNANIY